LKGRWIPMKRIKKEGLNEIGVVSAISAPLREVSILYLSTFSSANILVRKEDFEIAVSALQDAGFNVSTEEVLSPTNNQDREFLS